MTSDTPGTGQPDPGEPQAPGEPPPPPLDAPTEAVPPLDAPPPPDAAPPLDAAPPPGQWDTPPAAAPVPPPAAPPPAAAQPPQAPAAPAPAAPASPPQWGAPPAQQGTPTWGTPPAGGPPPGAPTPQQPAAWQPGAPGGAPGGPPNGTWNPAPAQKSNNGCLKACLIGAVILIILAIVVVIGLFWLGNQFVSDLGVDPNSGELKQCELVTGDEIDQIFGTTDSEVLPLGGLVDATLGQVLDKRVLRDAPDCWMIVSGDESNGVTGRVARAESVNATGDFAAAKAAATAGKYFGGDAAGLGDEAFCTGASEQSPSFGVLVRQGGSLVYVSLIDAAFASQGDWETTPEGVLISPQTCELAGQVAQEVLR